MDWIFTSYIVSGEYIGSHGAAYQNAGKESVCSLAVSVDVMLPSTHSPLARRCIYTPRQG